MTISISNWDRFQHYGKARPPWIKLYRDSLGDYDLMYRLEPSERWVLVGLWILAAEFDNEIPANVEFLQHRLRADVTNDLLDKLQTLGMIDVGAESRASLERVYSKKRRDREETEKKTTAPGGREVDEDNLSEVGSSVEANEGPPSSEPRDMSHGDSVGNGGDGSGTKLAGGPSYTRSELRELARTKLGLGHITSQDDATNARILNSWLYSSAKRQPMEIALAIEGAADMRDNDLIGWDSVKPGMPMTLKALNGPITLADQGDGAAQRVLYDVAVEHARKQSKSAPTASDLTPLAELIGRDE